ncbi:hypothetical protein PaoP5_104 [Pseudomonas phage PaoP5]|uniref:hypothetical protein n=1 Tax=Pseudomonas phage PaoP5 TaxID=1716042 RepID=UPI00073922C7|nr:hypothetical protein PaoP5_104 [Pseudomonas phage PaoP5]ALT58383.1 hypothetical protein PaoP5_104 [Pseudomonas phage PaoP5]
MPYSGVRLYVIDTVVEHIGCEVEESNIRCQMLTEVNLGVTTCTTRQLIQTVTAEQVRVTSLGDNEGIVEYHLLAHPSVSRPRSQTAIPVLYADSEVHIFHKLHRHKVEVNHVVSHYALDPTLGHIVLELFQRQVNILYRSVVLESHNFFSVEHGRRFRQSLSVLSPVKDVGRPIVECQNIATVLLHYNAVVFVARLNLVGAGSVIDRRFIQQACGLDIPSHVGDIVISHPFEVLLDCFKSLLHFLSSCKRRKG